LLQYLTEVYLERAAYAMKGPLPSTKRGEGHILEDISKNYAWIDGEVSEIKLLATNSYHITMPQNERADIFTYEFAAKADGTVTIVSKKEATNSPRNYGGKIPFGGALSLPETRRTHPLTGLFHEHVVNGPASM
jgi:hypothetical protein